MTVADKGGQLLLQEDPGRSPTWPGCRFTPPRPTGSPRSNPGTRPRPLPRGRVRFPTEDEESSGVIDNNGTK